MVAALNRCGTANKFGFAAIMTMLITAEIRVAAMIFRLPSHEFRITQINLFHYLVFVSFVCLNQIEWKIE